MATPMTAPRGALTGVRILDLGWAMAGPQATAILAAYGATVIRVESRARPDLARTSFGPIISADPYDGSGYFTNFNRNKRSLALNMTTERGRELFARLLPLADGVLENFSAGVLTRWGFSYERMRQIKPDLVYVSMAGFGHSGPYREYQTFGPSVQAISGLTHLSGYPEKEPAGWGFSYMDHTGGYYGAIAMLQALFHRRRTGEGQHVDLAQVEAAITVTGPAVLDYAVNGRCSRRTGNAATDDRTFAQGVYRCAPDPDPKVGDDAWVAIEADTFEEWSALCRVIGRSEWADERFTTAGACREHTTEIDAAINGWTRDRSPWEAMAAMQEAGVPAGAVQRSRDLAERDPQIAFRGMRPTVEHPIHGTLTVDGVPARFSRTPAAVTSAGPLMGEANHELLGDLLGLERAEIDALSEEGVLW